MAANPQSQTPQSVPPNKTAIGIRIPKVVISSTRQSVLCVMLWLPFVVLAEPVDAFIVDGDTIHLTDGRKIRLYGIDAPESDQPHGTESTKALHAALDAGDFWTDIVDRDRYDRDVTLFLYKDKSIGTSVQAKLIRQGHAWVYWKYCHRPECESWGRLERLAKESGRGLWANPTAIPPWQWRRR